jgi:hypothetical protein
MLIRWSWLVIFSSFSFAVGRTFARPGEWIDSG